ncbi:MAG TPA: efflux transporter outer membrane subunit [Steroidobacteraceae bacterium]|jgi:NodT family efflux transporter outer membrane factor (OMF) lipoprotein|nr:efflux transporter outer membrane subunit [Steroidobacteraceae bacterium]
MSATAMHGVLLAVAAALSACNLAPPYDKPPKVDTGGSFKEAVHGSEADSEGWKAAEPRDAALKGAWWEMYGDHTLDDLESRVAASNESVIAAEANYRAARALTEEARANYFPTLSLDPSVTRSKSSASVLSVGGVAAGAGGVGTTGTGTAGTGTTGTGTTGTGAGATGTGTTGAGGTGASSGSGAATGSSTTPRTIYALPLEASYQVDLWGVIRNDVAQNRFAEQATAAQLANVLLSTQSTLAQDYFQLRMADEERRILDSTLTDFQTNLHLVHTLYDNGLASEEDLAQAQTQLKSAQAQATDLGATRATFEHAIAVLIGVPPGGLSIPYVRFKQPLPAIPVDGVPANLIERRPDIAAAERQVASTNAGIGVARAAYFPTLSLTGSIGYESTSLSQLIEAPNRFWSFGPQLAQILFDGGARRAATAHARALNDQAAATYRQAVLSALQSVEDNLASLRILAEEARQQHDAATAAEHAVALSVVRYRTGVDSYVNVITAQNAFLSAREAEAQIELKQLTASVNLINNLGGGWSTGRMGEDARLAENPEGLRGQPKIPQGLAGSGANPPVLTPEQTLPERLLKEDEELMRPEGPPDSVPSKDSQPPPRP